jgi:hypothetical protein
VFGRNVPIPVSATKDWQSIGAGAFHSVGLRSDGSLWAWGMNSSGEVGDGSVAGAKGAPVSVGHGRTWSSVAAGNQHNLATQSDGSLWAWGLTLSKETGADLFEVDRLPVRVGVDTDWFTLACGSFHDVGIKRDGSLWTWGANMSGQLGSGSTVGALKPVPIAGDKTWRQIAAGGGHSLAIDAEGTVWSWGSNFYGQLGVPSLFQPRRVGADSDWGQKANQP